MNIKTCRYVEATEIFKDCHLAWELFADGNPDCTWGSNNRTMVTPDVISNIIDDRLENIDETHDKQINLVNSRLDSLEPDVYVDLEN
jgi:hypothetical protein